MKYDDEWKQFIFLERIVYPFSSTWLQILLETHEEKNNIWSANQRNLNNNSELVNTFNAY